MIKYFQPIPKRLVGTMPPSLVIPPKELIPAEFWQTYSPEASPNNTFGHAQQYIGAAIDYLQTKHPDRDNFLPRPENVNIEDAFAHLNYVVHNTFFPDAHKIAALAFLMHAWFKTVPPKFRRNGKAKIIATQ